VRVSWSVRDIVQISNLNVCHRRYNIYPVSKHKRKAINTIKMWIALPHILQSRNVAWVIFPMRLKSTQPHWLLVKGF